MDHAEFYQHKSVASFLRSIVAQLFGGSWMDIFSMGWAGWFS